MNSTRVKQFRRALRLTREGLARALNMSTAVVDRWEGEPDEEAREKMRGLLQSAGREDLMRLVTDPDEDEESVQNGTVHRASGVDKITESFQSPTDRRAVAKAIGALEVCAQALRALRGVGLEPPAPSQRAGGPASVIGSHPISESSESADIEAAIRELREGANRLQQRMEELRKGGEGAEGLGKEIGPTRKPDRGGGKRPPKRAGGRG